MLSDIRTLVVCFFFSSLLSVAYGQDGQVQGQVLDPSGAGIQKALVRVVDKKSGKEAKTQTNDNGQYTVPALAAGVYQVFIAATGFAAAGSDQITLNPGQSLVMDFTLKVGATSADVIVTAEKKGERLQDVPVPISVLNADDLADTSQVLLRDYYSSVPGLSVSPNFTGNQMLSIRGITTGGFITTTVGVLVDDVPFGLELGDEVPDFDPQDLDHIEVLRGPQGTLYGSDSMGGLIKYVTKVPSTDAYVGSVEGGTSSVYRGADPGANFRASANIPLADMLAIRVSGYTRRDPGYIDNPGNCDGLPCAATEGVNEGEAYGASASALWQPIDDFSLKLNALYQHTRVNGSSDVDVQPGLGDLQQNYIAGIGGYNRTPQLYSAVLSARCGPINVSSITGYNENHYTGSLDYSFAFGPLVPPSWGTSSVAYVEGSSTKRATEELRLSGSLLKNIDWLVGGFYSHTNDTSHFEDFFAYNPSTGRQVGAVLLSHQPEILEQYAAFADLTYHITDRFDVQIGGRENHDNIAEKSYIQSGSFVGPTPVFVPGVSSGDDAFTYLATPRFRFSPDLMVYARFASGFRPGGPNGTGFGLPASYGPDKTYNYEGGVKGEFFDRALSIDGSIYYIDWKDLQIEQRTPAPESFTYTGNGGGAKSEGAELSAMARLLTGLTLGAWVSYDNAVLTAPLVTSYGVPGDRLPNTPAWSGNISAEQDFSLPRNVMAFLGGDLTYVGDRLSIFQPTAQRQDFPSYTKTDLRVGVRRDTWTAQVYSNNVGDVRGQLNGGLGFAPPFAFIYIQPRTIGLSVTRTFGAPRR